MTLAWFAIYSPVSEFQVEADLQELGPKAGIDIDAYCPAVTKWELSPGRRVRVQHPLYPGYLFVGLRPDGRGDLPFPMIRDVAGVIDVLGARGAPIQLPYEPPDPEFTRLLREKLDAPWSILGLRMLEHARAFDFTRDARKAARAVRKAQFTFRSFADLGRFLDGAEANRQRAA